MRRLPIPLALAGVTAALAAAPVTLARGGAGVSTATSRLGTILVDGHGRTLYLFRRDSARRSACSGSCTAQWPPVITHGAPHAAGSARASRLGTIRRAGDVRQVTYGGHPLYRYIGDRRPGQSNGQGLSAFGGAWYVVSPSGRARAGY